MLTDRERARAGPRSMKAQGSPEWCWQTLDFFKDALRHVNEQYRQAEEVLEELQRVKAWEKVPPESPYGSFDAMLKAETGMSVKQLRNHISTAREKYGPVKAANPVGRPSGNVRDTNIKRSDTDEYVVARLKRDDPELAERVVNGEISPNAASREKGWRKPRVLLANPETVAKRIRETFTAEQIARLIALLLDGEQP